MEKNNKKVGKKKVTKKDTDKNKTKKAIKKVKKTTKNVSKPKKVIRKSTTNKTVNKSSKKKTVVNTLKVEKKEPWYIWLKNNIIENEEKYSKEDKDRRLVVTIFMVFCFFTVLFSAAIADYNYAYKNGKTPFFAIKTRDEYKQVTIYYGIFYKAWKCDNGLNTINFSRYSTEISYCKIVAKYDKDGVYTNPNNVKITESQMNIIKNYYYDDYIYFKTTEELERAYKISKEINKVWWVRKNADSKINNDGSIGLAIFGKTETKNGVDNWDLQYDNPEYYKCVKNVEGVNLFASYNYLDNTCDNDWESLSLNEETCKLTENSTEFVQNLVKLTGLCK